MGMFKNLSGVWPAPEHVKQVLERGQQAWDDGRPSFVYRQIATAGLSEEGLNDVLDGLLAIGWQLHSQSLAYNQTGLNTEIGLFVFLRP